MSKLLKKRQMIQEQMTVWGERIQSHGSHRSKIFAFLNCLNFTECHLLSLQDSRKESSWSISSRLFMVLNTSIMLLLYTSERKLAISLSAELAYTDLDHGKFYFIIGGSTSSPTTLEISNQRITCQISYQVEIFSFYCIKKTTFKVWHQNIMSLTYLC